MAPDYLIFTPKTRKESSEMAANGGQFCIFLVAVEGQFCKFPDTAFRRHGRYRDYLPSAKLRTKR